MVQNYHDYLYLLVHNYPSCTCIMDNVKHHVRILPLWYKLGLQCVSVSQSGRFVHLNLYLPATDSFGCNVWWFVNDIGNCCLQNLRPEIPRCCPSSLASIMRKCWDAHPERRPDMDEVVRLLEAVDTSKGGGMIPDDQAPGCFCFTARGPWFCYLIILFCGTYVNSREKVKQIIVRL